MSLFKVDKIRLCCEILLTILTVLLGAMLISQVLAIYYSGPTKPFTREVVSEHLSIIAFPAAIWIICVIGTVVFEAVFPKQKKRGNTTSPIKTLERLNSRIPNNTEGCEQELLKIKRRKTALTICRIVALAIATISAIICLCYLLTLNNLKGLKDWEFSKGVTGAFAYLLNAKNFDADPTKGVIAMMAHLLPWIVASMLCFSALSVFEYISAKNVLPAVKQVVANGAKQGFTPTTAQKKAKDNTRTIMIARIAIAVIAVTLIIAGAINGGALDVLIKAINICTECIGLG